MQHHAHALRTLEHIVSEVRLMSPISILFAYRYCCVLFPAQDAWLGFIHADLAILDAEEAWTRMQTLTHFDNGASLTNFLYWVATRPAN